MSKTASGHTSPSHPRGVALWEVLVIAAVVAVIAVPAFAWLGSTPSAKQTCQSNLKELGIAVQVYWNDYDATLPSSDVISHSNKWNRTDFLRFATKLGAIPPRSADRQTYAQVIYDYMKSKDILYCPSDPSNHKAANASASYWYKMAIDKAWFGDGCKPCRKEGDFAYTSDQILFYEHNSWHTNSKAGLVNGAQINVVYMDSHVRSITLKNATSGDPINCAANSDGEPMWYNYNLTQGKGLPQSTPAKFVDPRDCGDAF